MIPKYQYIADDLRTKIIKKEFLESNPLPTEAQLQEIYQVSRQTIRQAISLLVNEQYLYSKRGSGTFINPHRSHSHHTGSKKKNVGVITTYISDYIFPSIIRGIEEELTQNGYSLFLSSTNNNYEKEEACLKKMIDSHIDGLIVEPTKSNQFNPNLPLYLSLKEKGIPIITINSTYEELDVPSIAIDDTDMCFRATSELILNGHKQLLLITKIDDLQGKKRMKGFLQACEKHKISLSSKSIMTYTTESFDAIPTEVISALQADSSITGIVCYNDLLAKVLITHLALHQYRVPDDISVVSHDNSYLDLIGDIGLTSMNHPKEKLGHDAAKSIITAIEDKKQPKGIVYHPDIIRRNSIRSLLSEEHDVSK